MGDVILIESGKTIPADCILIEEMDMFVDQSMLFPGETREEK